MKVKNLITISTEVKYKDDDDDDEIAIMGDMMTLLYQVLCGL